MSEFEQHSIAKRRSIRVFVLLSVFTILFIAITVRLVRYQIIDTKQYKQIARSQYEKQFPLFAERGLMYDRNGNILVSNSEFLSFAADPKLLGDKVKVVAMKFSQLCNKPASFYLEKLEKNSHKKFVWLERHIDPITGKKIEQEKIEGVVVMKERKRLYHYDDIASVLIGFTDIDNKGIAGLELNYNETLKGIDGSIVMYRDGSQKIRPSLDYPRKDPVDGNDLILTIDLTYQSIVDEELRRGVEEQKADGGLVIMMNPKSGEILALSVYPRFNPNNLSSVTETNIRNRAITDIFEPGSVFKLVTAAAVYEHKIASPSDRFYAERGKMKVLVNGKEVRTITDSHPYEWLTFQEAIEVSSNIVCAKVAKQIGGERFYRMARDFGFGMLTGIDLPGEVRGILKRPEEWSAVSLQSLSYGYEVGVTPLQILCAYSVVANNGLLMKPYVVAGVRSHDGKFVHRQQPTIVRKVLSPQTVALLRQAFEGVVVRGTAKPVMMKSTRVAGKTGTARKWVDGKYVENNYTASFVGYFPAEDPQVVCLVMLDNPKASGYYGGLTSGPVFRAITERVVSTSYKFSPTLITQTQDDVHLRTVPDVRMLTVPVAKRLLASYNLVGNEVGKGSFVIWQVPEPGKKVQKGESVSLVLEQSSDTPKGQIRVPDVSGKSMRRAINRLLIEDFEVKVHGSGKVISQSPKAGEVVRLGSTVVLYCQFEQQTNARTVAEVQ